MKTNAERREVASRLRAFGETDLGSVNRELWNLIADLIEPEPERTCRDTSPMSYKFTCSECHSSYRFGSEHKVWYCPHCGAKLEGVGR